MLYVMTSVPCGPNLTGMFADPTWIATDQYWQNKAKRV